MKLVVVVVDHKYVHLEMVTTNVNMQPEAYFVPSTFCRKYCKCVYKCTNMYNVHVHVLGRGKDGFLQREGGIHLRYIHSANGNYVADNLIKP